MADTAQMQVSDEVAISIQNMNKWYGTFHVLRDIDLTVYQGERIVICGPSGWHVLSALQPVPASDDP